MNGLQPWLRPWAQALVRGFPELKVTSVFRSWTDQYRVWINRTNSPYPAAPPGRSYHQYGRAWDMVGPERLLAEAGRVWQSWGGTWSASDPIHFQA